MGSSGKAITISSVLGKIASIVGYIASVIALFIIIVAIMDIDSEGAVTAIILSTVVLAICSFLIYKGIKIKKRIRRFKKYISIISTSQRISLENIAVHTSQLVDFVRNDLQKMISKRFFVNTHIDTKTNELVIDWCDGADFGQDRRRPLAVEVSGCSGSGVNTSEPKGKPISCIEYVVTKEDLLSAYAYDLKKPVLQGCLLTYLGFYFVVMIFGCMLGVLYYFDAPALLLLIFILAMPVSCVLLAVFFSRRSCAARILKGRLKRGEIEAQYFSRHRLELKEDVIEIQYGTTCMRRQYAGIQKTTDYPGGIIVYNSQLDRDVIPSAAFWDTAQRSEFLNHLQSKIVQAKNTGVSARNTEMHEQDTSHVLEYIWNEERFISAMMRASQMLYKTQLFWTMGQIIMTLVGSILVLTSIVSFIRTITEISGFHHETTSVLPIGLCLGIGFVLLSPLLTAFTPFGKFVYKRQIDSGAIPHDFFSPQSLCFKEDRITEVRSLSSFDVMYDRVYCVKHDADGMYILLTDKRFFIIPYSAFSSDNQKQVIADYIEKKIKEYANNPR